MDQGIRAVWYDLPAASKEGYLSWLHNDYLPAVISRPGIMWAAHYEVTGGGANMDKIGEILERPEDGVVPAGQDYVLLVGAGSPHVFFKPIYEEVDAEDRLTVEMLSHRIGERICVFTEEARINGPEFDYRPVASPPGPAIQMGNFRAESLEDEADLAAWYAQYRFPAMARMKGCIATRKLVSVMGWAKHSILYEFTSLEARHEHFQNHESLALDDKVWTNRVINYTLHAPGSPSIGHRIWPAVD
ncbi:MAG: hypothetical protein CMM74_03025 [Rhodospirillaceae bacterium]|jgi:hypothetical protein|nr:hypothetical protein [Rhodospirillaceae bacterium]